MTTRNNTSVSLSPSETTVMTGDSVTFIAYVTNEDSDTVPYGSVSFYDGTTLLGSVSGSSGIFSYTTTSLLGTVGHSVTAVYAGNPSYFGSTSPAVVLMAGSTAPTAPTGPGGGSGAPALIVTTLALTASATSVMSGVAVGLTALLTSASSGASAPTGTIAFYDSATVLATLAVAASAATLSTAFAGTTGHALTAIYSGDSLYAPSTSTTVIVNSTDSTGVDFLPWIVTPPAFHFYGTVQTASASMAIQNVSGNTVQRDAALILLRDELVNALFIYRLYQADCEIDLLRVAGYVADPEIEDDGETLTMNLKGLRNWSEIMAPDCEIGVACGLQFGSQACGSTSPTPCNNSYGTCTSIERYKGFVLEWAGATLDYTQTVQPQPLRVANTKVAS